MEDLKIPLKVIHLIAGCGRARVYGGVNGGHLKWFRVGRLRFAYARDVQAWIEAGKPDRVTLYDPMTR